MKVLNQPMPAGVPRERPVSPSRTSYARSQELVGDRDPRQHEFTVQLRSVRRSEVRRELGVASWWPCARHC